VRVLLDTNIYISYLLTPNALSPILAVVDAAFNGEYVLLLPEESLQELAAAIDRSDYLRYHIAAVDERQLIHALSAVGESIPRIGQRITRVTRDRTDDYLIAYALVGEAEYLVSGDKDLLALGKQERFEIVSPRDFLQILLSGTS